MKINEIIVAQAVRLIRPQTTLYVPDVVQALQRLFGFVQSPSTATEMLPPAGGPLRFQHGKCVHDGRTIVVESVELYPNAVAVQAARSTTDDADIAMEHLLTAGAAFLAETSPQRLYVNQLDLTLDTHLDWASPIAARMGPMLSKMIASYNPQLPPDAFAPGFRLASLSMLIDPSQFPLPCDFRLERRAGMAYSENRYFSQAPLRTDDHIAMLNEMENQIRTLGEGK